MTLSFLHGLIVCLAGGCAGLVDSVAGGGGLIVVPTLLALGVSPLVTLGTNRLQSSVGELVAIHHYHKTGHLRFRRLGWAILFTVIGASLGTIAVQTLHNELLQRQIRNLSLRLHQRLPLQIRHVFEPQA